MNQGERDEFLIQLKLIQLRDSDKTIPVFGKITSVGLEHEYNKMTESLNLQNIKNASDTILTQIAKQHGISKACANYKADTKINSIPVSLKSNNAAPPAIVNHTTRPGFERIAKCVGVDISKLDALVDKYWELRMKNAIPEDIHNDNPISPFKQHKDILEPYLNYFLFTGTGSKASKLPAAKILTFANPLDIKTWHISCPADAIKLYWDNLVFSLRAKKGMPKGYPDNMTKRMMPQKQSVKLWTRYIDGSYRGALHIRTKK